MDPINVVIADAHALFGRQLIRFLEQQGDIQVIAKVVHGHQLLSVVEVLQPDILLLDVQMPKIGGLTGLPKIRAKSSKTKILILTDCIEEELIVRSLQHGAVGCLLANASPMELVKSVRTTYAGELWAQRKLVTYVVESLCQRLDELQRYLSWGREVLTSREHEVVTWTTEGMTNKEIAVQLGISEKIVKTHLQNVFRKLHVRRRVHLPRFRLTSLPPPAGAPPNALRREDRR